MTLRKYNPSIDANETYLLIQKLFGNSKLLYFENLEDFYDYNGWVIVEGKEEEDIIIAVLLYTYMSGKDIYYLDFIGSKVKGCGTKLLKHFLNYTSVNKNIYLHVEKSANMNRLISWYEKYGFVVSENIIEPLLFDMMEDVITMQRIG